MNMCFIMEYFTTNRNHNLSKLLAFFSSMVKKDKNKRKNLQLNPRRVLNIFYFNVIKGDQRM